MRREFPPKVRVAAFERANKRCEKCTAFLVPGRFTYDHRVADFMGGEPALENCQVICEACDKDKTYRQDIPAIAKTKRVIKRRAGVRKPRTITSWRKFSGKIVHKSRER